MSVGFQGAGDRELAEAVFEVAEERDFIVWGTSDTSRTNAAKVISAATKSDTDFDEGVLALRGDGGATYVLEQTDDTTAATGIRIRSASAGSSSWRAIQFLNFAPTPESVNRPWDRTDDDVRRWFNFRWDDATEALQERLGEAPEATEQMPDPTMPDGPEYTAAESLRDADRPGTDVDDADDIGDPAFAAEPEPVLDETLVSPDPDAGSFPSRSDSAEAMDADAYLDGLTDGEVTYDDLLEDMQVDTDFRSPGSYFAQTETPHTFVDELLMFGHDVPRTVGAWSLIDYGVVFPNNDATRKVVWEHGETGALVALVCASQGSAPNVWNVYHIPDPAVADSFDPAVITDDPGEAIDHVKTHLYGDDRNIDIELIERRDGSVDIYEGVDRQTLGNRMLSLLGWESAVDVPAVGRLYDARDSAIEWVSDNKERMAEMTLYLAVAGTTRAFGKLNVARRLLKNHDLSLGTTVGFDDDEGVPTEMQMNLRGHYTYDSEGAGEPIEIDAEFEPEVSIDLDKYDLADNNLFRRAVMVHQTADHDRFLLPIYNSEFDVVDSESTGNNIDTLEDIARDVEQAAEREADSTTPSVRQRLLDPSGDEIGPAVAVGVNAATDDEIYGPDNFEAHLSKLARDDIPEHVHTQAAIYALAKAVANYEKMEDSLEDDDSLEGSIRDRRHPNYDRVVSYARNRISTGDDFGDIVDDFYTVAMDSDAKQFVTDYVADHMDDAVYHAGVADEAATNVEIDDPGETGDSDADDVVGAFDEDQAVYDTLHEEMFDRLSGQELGDMLTDQVLHELSNADEVDDMEWDALSDKQIEVIEDVLGVETDGGDMTSNEDQADATGGMWDTERFGGGRQ